MCILARRLHSARPFGTTAERDTTKRDGKGMGMEKLAAFVFGILVAFNVVTGGELDVVARYRPVTRQERGTSW